MLGVLAMLFFLITRFERLTVKVLSDSLILQISSETVISYLLLKIYIYKVLAISVIKCLFNKAIQHTLIKLVTTNNIIL